MKIEVLDCTLRDGGYYTNWDFNQQIVENYFSTMEKLPIDYVEIGYINPSLKGYYGEYYFCPDYVFEKARKNMPSKKIAIMINVKSFENVDKILNSINREKDNIDLLRFAINPFESMEFLPNLLCGLKKLNIPVALNLMYLSKWVKNEEIINKLIKECKGANYIYLVDSFGGVFPDDLKGVIGEFKKTTSKIGFHPHNNLELALANTIVAIKEGVDIVDATLLGMGRGAGNLKTELILLYLRNNHNFKVNYEDLSDLIEEFEKLHQYYKWGTNFPYMISGAHNIPQAKIMDLLNANRYTYSSIIEKMSNNNRVEHIKSKNITANIKKMILLGAGESIYIHKEAIENYLNINDCDLIHASYKSYQEYKHIKNCKHYVCLTGNDLKYLKSNVEEKNVFFVIRTIQSIDFSSKRALFIDTESFSYVDSPLTLAFCLFLNLSKEKTINVVGLDGYPNNSKLFNENQSILNEFKEELNIISLTKSIYNGIEKQSIFSFL